MFYSNTPEVVVAEKTDGVFNWIKEYTASALPFSTADSRARIKTTIEGSGILTYMNDELLGTEYLLGSGNHAAEPALLIVTSQTTPTVGIHDLVVKEPQLPLMLQGSQSPSGFLDLVLKNAVKVDSIADGIQFHSETFLTPNEIDNLSVWLHADFGVVKSGSDLVSWTDQQNGKTGVGLGATPPQVNDTGFNGLRSIQLDNVSEDDLIHFAGGSGIWGNANGEQTIIMAAHRTGSTSNDVVIATNDFFEYWTLTNNQAQIRQTDATDTVDTAGGGVSDFDSEGIHVARYNGSIFDGWFNGTPYDGNPFTLTSSVPNHQFTDNVHLGNRRDQLIAFQGHYRIVLFYDTVLTEAQINNVVTNYVEPQCGLSLWSDI